VSVSEQLAHYMAAAVNADGGEVLAVDVDPHADSSTALGRRLLLAVYGAWSARGQLPPALQRLIAEPEDTAALDALEHEVQGVLDDNPWIESVVSDMLLSFYEQEAAAGNIEAMLDLGHLLRWQGDLGRARDAYQQAFDCGNAHAMIELGRLLRGDLGDAQGARAAFKQAISSGDAQVALEATLDLGHLLLLFQRDVEGARSAFEHVITSGHPEWAPVAMVSLALLLQKQGDIAEARNLYQQAIESGHADSAERASAYLGRMQERNE
jgi:tetratricopeptide (TPR) repeat protein